MAPGNVSGKSVKGAHLASTQWVIGGCKGYTKHCNTQLTLQSQGRQSGKAGRSHNSCPAVHSGSSEYLLLRCLQINAESIGH